MYAGLWSCTFLSGALDHAWDTGDSLWFHIKWGLGDLTWQPLSNCDGLSALDDYLILHGVDKVESLLKESCFPSPLSGQ
jgi:hypothetical protein